MQVAIINSKKRHRDGLVRRDPNSGTITNPVLISDDFGGAIITWMESSKNATGASRIRASGTQVWDKLLSFTSGLRKVDGLQSIWTKGITTCERTAAGR
jgi:hypothetical protein